MSKGGNILENVGMLLAPQTTQGIMNLPAMRAESERNNILQPFITNSLKQYLGVGAPAAVPTPSPPQLPAPPDNLGVAGGAAFPNPSQIQLPKPPQPAPVAGPTGAPPPMAGGAPGGLPIGALGPLMKGDLSALFNPETVNIMGPDGKTMLIPKYASSQYINKPGYSLAGNSTPVDPATRIEYFVDKKSGNAIPVQRDQASTFAAAHPELIDTGDKPNLDYTDLAVGAKSREAAAAAQAGESAKAQYDTVTIQDPSDPRKQITVRKSDIPKLFAAMSLGGNVASLGSPGGFPNTPVTTPTSLPVPALAAGQSPTGAFEEKAATAGGALTQHLQDLQRLKDQAAALAAHPGLGGIVGASGSFPNIPGGHAADAEAQLNSLGGNALTDVYNSARQLSTTGGGFGRLTETEIPIFKGIYASLDKKQSPTAFKANLKKIQDYADESMANLKGTYKQEYGKDYQPPAPAKPSAPQAYDKPPMGSVTLPDGRVKTPDGKILKFVPG
jgi:hypothetical protein